MKSIGIILAIVLAGSLPSCIQAPTTAVLERMDPAPAGPATIVETGHLTVFSAFETGPPSPAEIDPDISHYSDYKILRGSGQVVAKVKNRSGALGQGPATVELPPGTYQLVAEANGYGRITVPVAIVGEQVTTVHLDGAALLPRQPAFAETYLVRLANGRTVGWCATTSDDRRR